MGRLKTRKNKIKITLVPKKAEIKLRDGEEMKDIHLDGVADVYSITNFGRCFNKITGAEIPQRIGDSGYYVVDLQSV